MLEVMPRLVARGSLRESKVRRLYLRDLSELWLKNMAILSKICVSVMLLYFSLYSRYLNMT